MKSIANFGVEQTDLANEFDQFVTKICKVKITLLNELNRYNCWIDFEMFN